MITIKKNPTKVVPPEADILDAIEKIRTWFEGTTKIVANVSLFGHELFSIRKEFIEEDVRKAASEATEYTKV